MGFNFATCMWSRVASHWSVQSSRFLHACKPRPCLTSSWRRLWGEEPASRIPCQCSWHRANLDTWRSTYCDSQLVKQEPIGKWRKAGKTSLSVLLLNKYQKKCIMFFFSLNCKLSFGNGVTLQSCCRTFNTFDLPLPVWKSNFLSSVWVSNLKREDNMWYHSLNRLKN